jgi:lipopolysaccharide export system protein LptA
VRFRLCSGLATLAPIVLASLVSMATATRAHATSVGVAPFEAIAAQGESIPDVASHVAERLATRGLGTVRGPQALGGEARFEPSVADVQQWAERGGVEAVVAGRTTKIGSQLSLHARLFDGTSGLALGAPLIEEVVRPEDFGRALDRLTGALVERIETRMPGVASATSPPPKPAGGRAVGARFDRKQPLSIHSDELEAAPDASGQRRLLFAGHVRAEQGDLSLVADRLEAIYRAGASEPHRLQARGHVTIQQGTRIARCAEATFYRDQDRVVCTGQLAEIEQGCDSVRGPRITFDLGSERLEVEGGADVSLRPDCVSTAAGAERGP